MLTISFALYQAIPRTELSSATLSVFYLLPMMIKLPLAVVFGSPYLEDDQVTIVWTERGGPPVEAPAEGNGFGSNLLKRSVSSGLNGSIEHNWSAEGAIITLRIDKERLLH